ncbi:YolD-like protein [Gracilibacillus ureilyticus]|uniref:YolD-like protein n=1 Tax=Gracilibacillus ureilyticus TaxID=531814 RepID=A0A1H9NP49_9BACI|nr:YolD-like family protein [Gracilibacillus ureilyticus]SER37527.1 YolD-like protein [Gracilibacillus ureilyticus]
MHNDRGSIKWASLMLPEHVKILRDMWQEDETEAKKEIDEQQLEENAQILAESFFLKKKVAITYYNQNHYKTDHVAIIRIDRYNQTIRVENADLERITIPLENIWTVES